MSTDKEVAMADAQAKMKPFWLSKTLWLNALAGVALFVQAKTGFVVSPEIQGYLLIAINAGLRAITKTEVTIS